MLSTRTLVFALCAYAAPLVVYGLIFGPGLSDSHARWAEFGSAMAGIYAPIVALMTLAVLIRQTKLQGEINDHQYRQAYVAQARADIDFYAVNLAEAMKLHALPGVTIRAYLHQHFQPPELQRHDTKEAQHFALALDGNSPQVMGMWAAVYPIIAGLENGKRPAYDLTLASSLQRLIAVLSFETCVCLDNYHRARCGGQLKVPYKFSPLLTATSAA